MGGEVRCFRKQLAQVRPYIYYRSLHKAIITAPSHRATPHSPHISAKVRTHPSLVLKLYSPFEYGGGDRPSARHLYSDLSHGAMPSSAGGAVAAQTQCRPASTPRLRNLSPCRAGGKD
eukprot:scaffold133360_cov118-Phaeocystis_antarctica.AAC.1